MVVALFGCGPVRDSSVAQPSSSSAESPAEVYALGAWEYRVARARLLAAATRLEDGRRCQFVPYEKDGVVVGVKMYGVKLGFLTHQLGIRNGDAILAVNGISAATAAGAVRIREEFRHAERVAIELERAGRKLTLVCRITDPADAAAAAQPGAAGPTLDAANLEWLAIARWCVGGLVAIFGLYVIGLNWATIPWNWRLARRGVDQHVSTVPVVGPLLFCTGLACIAWPPSVHVLWSWIIDWPTVSLPLALWYARRS